jgi:hypothetical protein
MSGLSFHKKNRKKMILGPRNDSCTTINTTPTHNCLQSKKKIKIKMLYTEVGCVGVVLVVVQESFLLEPY